MYWNKKTKTWNNDYTERLICNDKPILLVPKRIVSYSDKYTSAEYRQHFVLNYLQNEHLRLQTALVKKVTGTIVLPLTKIGALSKVIVWPLRTY